MVQAATRRIDALCRKYAQEIWDIVNPDFFVDDAGALWNALRDVLLFWIEQGVGIFRVDNPPHQAVRFWEWLIHDIQLRHHDVIFLADSVHATELMKGLPSSASRTPTPTHLADPANGSWNSI